MLSVRREQVTGASGPTARGGIPTLSAASFVLVMLSATSSLLAQGAPEGGDRTDADALFEEGRRLMLAGHHVEACPLLEASQRLDPAVGTLLHLGECYAQTGRSASAWRTFREAVVAARAAAQPAREQVALQRAQNIEPELARLQVSVPLGHDLPGLVVKTDGVELPRGFWGAAIPVDPGPHVIDVSAPRHTPQRIQAAVMQAGNTVVISIPQLAAEGEPRPQAAATLAEIPPSSSGPVRRSVPGMVSLAAGTAAMAVGAGFGVMAFRSWADARSVCTDNICPDEGVRHASSAHTYATVSTALVVAGGLGAGVGAYLLLRASPEKGHALWIAPGVSNLALGGRFE